MIGTLKSQMMNFTLKLERVLMNSHVSYRIRGF